MRIGQRWKDIPQGLKPAVILGVFSARLKSCPDTKLQRFMIWVSAASSFCGF